MHNNTSYIVLILIIASNVSKNVSSNDQSGMDEPKLKVQLFTDLNKSAIFA